MITRMFYSAAIILGCAAIALGVLYWYIETVTQIFMSFP